VTAECGCDFGPGLATAHCPACHRTFTTGTSFGLHQEAGLSGAVTCRDPATVRRANGDPVFKVARYTPGRRPVWAKAAAREGEGR